MRPGGFFIEIPFPAYSPNRLAWERAPAGAGGVFEMRNEFEARAEELAHFIIDKGATVRAAAARFGVSKSTVHKDVTERLHRIDPRLEKEVRRVLDRNKAERHIRGGMATREKYLLRKA